MFLEVQTKKNKYLPMTDKIKTNGEMISTKRAAEILGVSLPRVRRMILDGFFEGVEKFGQNNAIPLAEVERVKVERDRMEKDEHGKILGGRPRKEKGN